MPPDTNPAEFMLDLVNNEFTDPQSVREVLEVCRNSILCLVAGSKGQNVECGGICTRARANSGSCKVPRVERGCKVRGEKKQGSSGWPSHQ